MNDASVSRMNLWLVVALIVAIMLLVAAAFVMVQPLLSHWLGGMLQAPQQMAPGGNGVGGSSPSIPCVGGPFSC